MTIRRMAFILAALVVLFMIVTGEAGRLLNEVRTGKPVK